MDPATNIRMARRRAGMTQSELARRAGTSQTTLSAYENGHKEPSVATLRRLLAASGHRLTVESGHQPVREPTKAQLAGIARALSDVLALAEALPKRHDPSLRFPGRRVLAGGAP